MGPQNLTVAVAGLIMQFVLAVVLFTSALFYNAPDNRVREDGLLSMEQLLRFTAFLTMTTFAALLFCQDVTNVSSRMFGIESYESYSIRTALTLVFTIDAVLLFLICHKTGGIQTSPFTSAFFAIPALAVFLHQPPRVVSYLTAGIIAVSYVDIRWWARYGRIDSYFAPSNWFTTFWIMGSMLALTSFLGLNTAPLPPTV